MNLIVQASGRSQERKQIPTIFYPYCDSRVFHKKLGFMGVLSKDSRIRSCFLLLSHMIAEVHI